MAQIQGTNVGGPVVPYDTSDTFASHKALYGQGGLRTVATLVARNAIPANRLEEGMQVYVVATQTTYRLKQGYSVPTVNNDWEQVLVAGSIMGSDLYLGNGQDGDVILAAPTTTLTSVMYYNNLTIGNGLVLKTNGYPIYVRNTLTIANGAFLQDNGNDGANAVSKNGGAGGLGSHQSGGDGATGVSGPGVAGNFCPPTIGMGGSGGACGDSGAGIGGLGFAGFSSGFVNPDPYYSYVGRFVGHGGGGGSGGNAGAGDGNGMQGGGGGGGGGSPIGVTIYAQNVINNGTISAKGGKGGNGATGLILGDKTGGGSGGGGGGGGFIYIYYGSLVNNGTITAVGGVGGNGAPGWNNGGGPNPPEINGKNGTAGGNGKIVLLDYINGVVTVS